MRTLLPGDPVGKTEEFKEWLLDHEIEPSDCFRIEMTGDEMMVFCYDRNKRGSKYVVLDPYDPECGKPATRTPELMKVKRPIPEAADEQR